MRLVLFESKSIIFIITGMEMKVSMDMTAFCMRTDDGISQREMKGGINTRAPVVGKRTAQVILSGYS